MSTRAKTIFSPKLHHIKTVTFLFVLIFFALYSQATNYYVSANGSNTNNGKSPSTPFQTLTACNTLTLQPGDTIFFRRGDTFRGQLTLRQSGTVTAPIVVTAYGSGANPVIQGSEVVNNFASSSTHIYSAPFSTNPVSVYISGAVSFPARFPNTGFLTIDSSASERTFYDASLTQAADYWNGATVHNRI